MKRVRQLEYGYFKSLKERCVKQCEDESRDFYLTQYYLKSEDKLTLLIDKEKNCFHEIISRDGKFSEFPGIEYDEEWLREFEYLKVEEYVKYGAYILKHQNNSFIFLWIIQPYMSDPGDEWGFGMEEQAEIILYSYINQNGKFIQPFKIFSMIDRGYCVDFI